MRFIHAYIQVIDRFNRYLGQLMMYSIFIMIGVLLWSSISKTFFLPANWTLEIAQFAMVSYYIIGGGYSIQTGANVRMDLFYSRWSIKRKAQMDILTVFFLIFYLAVLLHGGLGSLAYSLGHYGTEPYQFLFALISGNEEIGRLERSPTAWRPYLWPIKGIMCFGVFMMLLQVIAELFKDIIQLNTEQGA